MVHGPMTFCLPHIEHFGLNLPLRVQVPNNHILIQNLYYKYYCPNPKYLIIGYMDPLGASGASGALLGLCFCEFWLGAVAAPCFTCVSSVWRQICSTQNFSISGVFAVPCKVRGTHLWGAIPQSKIQQRHTFFQRGRWH